MVDREYIEKYMKKLDDQQGDMAFFVMVLLDELNDMDKRIEELENGRPNETKNVQG